MAASNRDEPLTFINPSTSSFPIAVSNIDTFLLDPNSQMKTSSGSFQKEGFLGGLDDAAEFRQSPLVGTVENYDRHVFLCYKNPQDWPPRIEAAEFDRLPRLLSAALFQRKGDMKKQTCLTICEGHDGAETSNGDVLIFPDMIRYRRLTHFDVDTFVEEVLVKDVITRFKEEIKLHGLQCKVSVSPCSHIGGHKYAGNVIIFASNINGEVTGHWYGYVTPDDVPVLLEQHIGKGEIVDSLWWGQMGLSEEDQKRSQELRLQLNGKTSIERSTNDPTQENEITSAVCRSEVEVMSCCWQNGSSPCCRNPSVPEKTAYPKLNEREAKLTAEKKSERQQIFKNNSGKGACTQRVCAVPTWFESWEREDTYAAIAVIGAALSVAFAYSCYKQLR